jgi:hypothetical protein
LEQTETGFDISRSNNVGSLTVLAPWMRQESITRENAAMTNITMAAAIMTEEIQGAFS